MTASVDIDVATTSVAVTQPAWFVEIVSNPPSLAIGLPGPSGPPGRDGIDGTDGTDGTDGVDGAKGDKGDTGAQGPKGDTGAQGPPGGSTDVFRFRAKAPTVTGDPGPGFLRWNNVTQRLSTVLAIDVEDQDALDVTVGLANITKGMRLYIQDHDGPSVNFQIWEFTAAGTPQGGASGWWDFPVKLIDAQGTGFSNFANGLMLAVRIERIGSGYVRTTTVATSPSLVTNTSWQGNVSLPPGYRIYRVATDRAARVRLYTNVTAQAADAVRPVGQDPVGDHGLILEYVTTAGVLAADLSPLVDGYDLDGDGSVAITVTNMSGATSTVATTLTYIRTE